MEKITYYLECVRGQNYYEKCLNAYKNLSETLKDKHSAISLVINLCLMQMQRNNIDKLELVIDDINARGVCINDSTIIIDSKFFKRKLTKQKLVELSDVVFHELAHLEYNRNLTLVKKNMKGSINGKYFAKFNLGSIQSFISQIFDCDFSYSFDNALALYATDANEEYAKKTAEYNVKNILLDAKCFAEKKNKNVIEDCEEKYNKYLANARNTFKNQIQMYNYCKTTIIKNVKGFQINSLVNLNDKEFEHRLNTARYIYKDDATDQLVYNLLINKQQYKKAGIMLNLLDFKNTEQNVLDFIEKSNYSKTEILEQLSNFDYGAINQIKKMCKNKEEFEGKTF